MFWFSLDIYLRSFFSLSLSFFKTILYIRCSIIDLLSSCHITISQAEEWRRSVAHDHKYADLADISLVSRVSWAYLWGAFGTGSDMSD